MNLVIQFERDYNNFMKNSELGREKMEVWKSKGVDENKK